MIGLQVANAFHCCQMVHAVEPVSRRGEIGIISKRIIEDDSGDVETTGMPTTVKNPIKWSYVIVTSALIAVIIERQDFIE